MAVTTRVMIKRTPPATKLVVVLWQSVSRALPLSEANPAAQLTQSSNVEYVPAGQKAHFCEPLFECVPGLHTSQVVGESAPSAVEYLPAPHAKHVPLEFAPFTVEYVPGGQASQKTTPSTSEYLPASHAKHVSFKVAPTASEYVPGAQPVHCVEPGCSAY